MVTYKDVQPGYYWARWIGSDPDTKDHDIFEERTHFEPVQVTENHRAPNHPQHLRVFILGFDGTQDIRNFEWGEEIKRNAQVLPFGRKDK